MEQMSSYLSFSRKFTFEYFRDFSEKIQVSLKYRNNNAYFTGTPIHIYDNFWLIFFVIRNVSAKLCREVRTHFISNYFLSDSRVIYEIMWKNRVEPERKQMTI